MATSNYYDFYYNEEENSTYQDNDIIPDSTPNVPAISPFQGAALFFHIVVFVVGVPGNALVVWMTAYEMKRSVNTVWFLNLAIADLLCCLSVPFTIMEVILGHWPLRLFACKLLPSILLINMYASVLLLTVISIDRCALVIKPVWCQNKRTVKKAYLACTVVWLLALILTSPSFIFRDIYRKNELAKDTCVLNYSLAGGHIEKVMLFIAIFRFLMGFIIPFLVITLCYSILMAKVSGRYTQSGKTMKVVLVVITAFFLCWFPYHVAGFILVSNPRTSDLYKSTLRVDPLIISFAFVNSCINPLIYVLVGQDFKSKFRKSIKSILRNVLAEELSQSSDSKKTKSSSETKNTDTRV
ncbi:C5a anaphylatoxin chemotactic receptor 1-like [Rhinophrynus dorsalis]